MEYKLGVKDRLVLLGILPAEGNLVMIRIVRELREGLSFSEAEHKDLQMTELEGGRLRWEEGAVPEREFEIGAKGQETIRKALEKLDKDEKLAADHLALCDLFEYTGD